MSVRTTTRVATAFCAVTLAFGPALETASAQQARRSSGSANTRKTKGKGSHRRSRRPRGQKAPEAQRILEIQQALAKDGTYMGTATGKWDAETTDAMKRFQAGHGLNPTGKLDARSLQQLGLGSDIAGVAPPARAASASTAAPEAARQPR